jgi:membrane protein required for colicin V production
MTAFDYAVIGVLFASVVLGWWRGVVGEVLALAAWIAAFFAARLMAPMAVEFVPNGVTGQDMRLIVAWIAVFVGVLVIFALVRMIIKTLLKAVGLGWLDRLLGASFGIVRGLLVVAVLVLVAGLTPLPTATWWREAMLAPPFETVVLAAKPWMPQELARRIGYR